MTTFNDIEKAINAVKKWNPEIGNDLHRQFHHAKNSSWTKGELSEYIKSDNNVADEYYTDEYQQHLDIREIQDLIINFFGE